MFLTHPCTPIRGENFFDGNFSTQHSWNFVVQSFGCTDQWSKYFTTIAARDSCTFKNLTSKWKPYAGRCYFVCRSKYLSLFNFFQSICNETLHHQEVCLKIVQSFQWSTRNSKLGYLHESCITRIFFFSNWVLFSALSQASKFKNFSSTETSSFYSWEGQYRQRARRQDETK